MTTTIIDLKDPLDIVAAHSGIPMAPVSKAFHESTVGKVAQAIISKPENHALAECFPKNHSLTTMDVENVYYSLREQMTQEQWDTIRRKQPGIISLNVLKEMQEVVQKNHDEASYQLGKHILPDDQADEDVHTMRAWIRNADNKAHLDTITSVHLGQLGLKVIPQEIQHLTQLEQLDLFENEIQVIPSKVLNLTQLQRLYLEHNQIQEISPEIHSWSQERELNLSFNPIEQPLQEITCEA